MNAQDACFPGSWYLVLFFKVLQDERDDVANQRLEVHVNPDLGAWNCERRGRVVYHRQVVWRGSKLHSLPSVPTSGQIRNLHE